MLTFSFTRAKNSVSWLKVTFPPLADFFACYRRNFQLPSLVKLKLQPPRLENEASKEVLKTAIPQVDI